MAPLNRLPCYGALEVIMTIIIINPDSSGKMAVKMERFRKTHAINT